MYVDSHAHLDMLDDPEGVLARAAEAGVRRVVTIGVDAATSEWATAFARGRTDVHATVGLHPHDAKDRTDELMARLGELAREDVVVGVGEAGLDYFYDNSPREEQRAVFAEQIRIAHATGKALVIHSRDAWDDTFAILRAEGAPPRTVFHCFTGGPQEAALAVELGCSLSFSGIVTFPNAGSLRDAARETPLDRILIETDSPFLSPVPHRGTPNEPAFVVHVAEAIGEVKGIGGEAVGDAAAANTARLFGWA